MVWTCSENGRGETTKKSYEMEPTSRKKTQKNLKLPGWKGLEDQWGGKGINRKRVE